MKFVTPKLSEFPTFLKNIESRWKLKLARRADRERYVATKEELVANSTRPRYILSMFPYPSGSLHLGHVRIYTSGDLLSRFSRLLCKNQNLSVNFNNVIHPMGFDSFGLPAENAARERGLDPAAWTNSNIRTMKKQLDDLSLQFDWREATSNPSFYKWTQELFLKLMDADLVYKSFAQVNWDPVDQTVLADEQVDEDGRSWRSGALVEKRNYRQWFIKVNALITDIYKAEDIDKESWRDVLSIQRTWTGQPSGWLFYIKYNYGHESFHDTIPIFTKQPELFLNPETRLVISNDHWLEQVHNVSVKGYIHNPFTNGKLPIELTDDVDSLPANSKATLKLQQIGNFPDSDSENSFQISRSQVIMKAKLLKLGGYYTSDSYRDWLISRQRFWGTPIPVLNCNNCGFQGVPRESLPVKLPEVSSFEAIDIRNRCTDSNFISSPIEKLASKDWIEVECPSCKSTATRECETFDTLFDSSWYFLRYASAALSDKPYDPDRVQPVWCYIGGIEHSSMHLFYARFMTHFLFSLGMLKFREPFNKLLVQGVVKSKTYKVNGKYISKDEAERMDDNKGLTVGYEKMSKSKGNGINPQELLDTYGVDATRFCLMSYANPRSERLWRSNREEFKDVLIFMRKVALTVQEYSDIGNSLRDKSNPSLKVKELDQINLDKKREELIKALNESSILAIFHIQDTNQFRQFISVMHSLLAIIRQNIANSVVYSIEFANALAALIVMLNPIAPHFSEELWLHFSSCIINPLKMKNDSVYKMNMQASDQPWPIPDDNHPLLIKILSSNSDGVVDKIPISKEDLRNLDNTGISNLVEKHFASKGDSCKVIEVRKYSDLMAYVIGDIESVNKAILSKRLKKKQETNS